MDPLIVVFGLGVGILVGMTGVGGGSLMTPLLILVFGVKPVLAIGTDLGYAAITKTLGGWRHFRSGAVDMPLSLWMAVGSIPGALFGVGIIEQLHVDEDALILMVAAAVLFTGLMTVGRALLLPPKDERHSIEMTGSDRIKAVGLGVAVGIVLGMTSAGSGALIAVGLLMLFRMNPRRVVGTDVFHAAILLWAAGIAHWVGGNVDFVLAANILLGSVPGVVIGAALSDKAPQGLLRTSLGLVLIGSGIVTVQKGDPSVWPIAAAVAAIGLGAILYAPRWINRRRERQLQQEQEADQTATLARTLPAD